MMRRSLMTRTAMIARTRTFFHGPSSSCGSLLLSRIGLVAGSHLVVAPSLLAMGGQGYCLARRGYQELAYSQRGEPVEQLEHYTSNDDWVPDPPTSCLSAFDKEDWILVELLAAPSNPADLNVVQGKYPSPHNSSNNSNNNNPNRRPSAASYLDPKNRLVGGAEALGRVVEVRNNDNEATTSSSSWKVGDAVVLGESGWGSWRSHVWVPAGSLLRVPTDLMELTPSSTLSSVTLPQVALLSQVAGTAYRLLHDFTNLQPNDVVIQNAGTSAVSMCVAELMRILFPTSHLVSFVRRAEEDDEWSELVNLLTCNRTTQHTVISESTAMAVDKSEWRDWKKQHLPTGPVVLGLNSVHGPQTSQLFFDLLANDARLVTYGAMSRQALPVPAAPLIFRNVTVCGYWHSRWMVNHRMEPGVQVPCPRQEMLNALSQAVVEGGLTLPPVHAADLSQVSQSGLKEIFDSVPTKPLRAKLVWNLQK